MNDDHTELELFSLDENETLEYVNNYSVNPGQSYKLETLRERAIIYCAVGHGHIAFGDKSEVISAQNIAYVAENTRFSIVADETQPLVTVVYGVHSNR